MKSRPIRNIVLPAVLIVSLMWLMAGCLDIPTPEHVVLTGSRQDFRPWMAKRLANDNYKNVTENRIAIVESFGRPAFESKSGKCAAYVINTERGIEIWPLCFGAGYIQGRTHVVELVYGDDGNLKRLIPLSDTMSPPMYYFGSQQYGSDYRSVSGENLIREHNQTCPPDEYIEFPTTDNRPGYQTWP
jgi:hypothetical protein